MCGAQISCALGNTGGGFNESFNSFLTSAVIELDSHRRAAGSSTHHQPFPPIRDGGSPAAAPSSKQHADCICDTHTTCMYVCCDLLLCINVYFCLYAYTRTHARLHVIIYFDAYLCMEIYVVVTIRYITIHEFLQHLTFAIQLFSP